MPRPGVSYETVAAAADQLRSRGIYPSVEKVRNITLGSKTTVWGHMRVYHQKLKALSASEPIITDNPEISENHRDLLIVNDNLLQETDELTYQISQLEIENQKKLEQLDNFKNVIESLKVDVAQEHLLAEDLETQLEESDAFIKSLRADLSRAMESIEHANARIRLLESTLETANQRERDLRVVLLFLTEQSKKEA